MSIDKPTSTLVAEFVKTVADEVSCDRWPMGRRESMQLFNDLRDTPVFKALIERVERGRLVEWMEDHPEYSFYFNGDRWWMDGPRGTRAQSFATLHEAVTDAARAASEER